MESPVKLANLSASRPSADRTPPGFSNPGGRGPAFQFLPTLFTATMDNHFQNDNITYIAGGESFLSKMPINAQSGKFIFL